MIAFLAGFAWGAIVAVGLCLLWWSKQPNRPPLPLQKKSPILPSSLPDAEDAASPEPPISPIQRERLVTQLAVIEQDTDVHLSPAEREAEAERLLREFHYG